MTTSLPRPRVKGSPAQPSGREHATPSTAGSPTDPSHARQSAAAIVAVKRIFAAETGNYF
ncbi:MAG: hypothetical protein QOI70_522, partial [Microbacteriaceae bacterium]|nr:hypothetical protein [Microbacteriaceae bacterium]